jgi:hypothetical protein
MILQVSAEGSSRHSGPEIFAATGERRQLFARDTDLSADAPLVRIERGQASALRIRARSGKLLCPMPACPDPRYTTSGGSRRDHFVHLSIRDGGHSPETWFHYTAKRLIGEWLVRRHPEVRVVVDEEAVESRQIPDVLAEFPDGSRFAFEVQYAALTLEDWVSRHVGYRNQGIFDVWLLGHTSRFFRHARAEYLAGRVLLGPLAAALWEEGTGPYWINPDEGTIASSRWWTDPSHSGRRPGQSAPHDVAVGLDALDDCRLDVDGFRTPTDDLERAAWDRLEEKRIERERQAREAMARQQLAAEQARQERAAKAAYREAREEKERLAYEAWLQAGAANAILSVLPILETRLPRDQGIWRYHADWHCRLFLDLVQGHVGAEFTYNQACGPWMDYGGSRKPVFIAVSDFLFHLRSHGFLSFESRGYWIDSDIRVVGDADHAQPPLGDGRPASPSAPSDPAAAARLEALERWRRSTR